MRRGALLLFLLVALVPRAGWATPEQDLEQAEHAYERSDYKRAIELIRPLLYPAIRLSNQKLVIQAYKLLGISYVFEKNKTEAEKQFLAILSIAPTYKLDPLVDPGAAVKFFEGVKKRNADKIRAILERERKEAERRRKEEERRRAEQRRLELLARQGQVFVERTVTLHPYWINFVPLGAGQFQNGHRGKGYALMGTQLTLGLLSAGTGLAGYLAYAGRPLNTEEYDRARALSIVQVVSAGLCAAAVVYGVIDALVYHEPMTVTEKRYKRNPKGSGKAALTVTPTLGPSSAGLGLGFTF